MNIEVIILRLVLAVFISGIIGLDREFKNRPAGIRTHILVCVGATIIAILQKEIMFSALEYAQSNPQFAGVIKVDEARLIAQVVSGVGFLGAGTIIVTKRNVRGLTTAASLWVVAGLGLALGMGSYKLGILGFLVVLVVLTSLKNIMHVPTLKKIEIKSTQQKIANTYVRTYFTEKQIDVNDMIFKADNSKEISVYTTVYAIDLPKNISYMDIIENLSYCEAIINIQLVDV